LEQTQPEQNGRLGSSFKLVGTPKILKVFAKLWFSVLDGDFQRFLYEARPLLGLYAQNKLISWKYGKGWFG
jgi:hypothetical protein